MENNKFLKVLIAIIILVILGLGGYFILSNTEDTPANNGESTSSFRYGTYRGHIESYFGDVVDVYLTLNEDGTASLRSVWRDGNDVELTRGTFTKEGNYITYTRLYMDLGDGEVAFNATAFEHPISETEQFEFMEDGQNSFINADIESITDYGGGFSLSGTPLELINQ